MLPNRSTVATMSTGPLAVKKSSIRWYSTLAAACSPSRDSAAAAVASPPARTEALAGLAAVNTVKFGATN
jgi:hypothetical protein